MNHLRAYSGSKIPYKRSEDDPMLKAMAEANETPNYGAIYRRKPMTNPQGSVIGKKKKKKSRGGCMDAAYATTAPAPIHILPYVDDDEEDDFGLSQTKKYSAISNKTMAEILKRTNPDCLKSMAGIQAQEAINKSRASMGLRPIRAFSERMDSEEQKLTEKFVAEILAQKAHVMMFQKASEKLAQKIQEMSTADGQAGAEAEGGSQGQEAFLSKEERVQRAHFKLHKAMGLK